MKNYKQNLKKGYVNQLTVTITLFFVIISMFAIGAGAEKLGLTLDASTSILAN